MSTDTPAKPPEPAPTAIRLLSQEQRNDLRKRVLAGEEMSLEDAKAVVDTVRQGRGAAALSQENKPKKQKKAGMTDADLNASLDAKFG